VKEFAYVQSSLDRLDRFNRRCGRKLLMPGKDPGGWIVTIVLGLAGSFIASYLGRMVGWYREGQSAGFIMSVLGAILLLFLYRMFIRKKPA
jgi:uncharacterized membrane protein YeaQ/YmgE (transglycosylase-associated protein family)